MKISIEVSFTQPQPTTLVKEEKTVNGVNMTVYHRGDGSSWIAHSDCHCFGAVGRTHTSVMCPNRLRFLKENT